jgi:beta-amylase
LTTGYWNIPGVNDIYGEIAKLCSAHNVTFDFTCLEMKDAEQSSSCKCGPYELVQQTKQSAIDNNAAYCGENALERYDTTAYNTIKSQATALGHNIDTFTYLRLSDTLMSGSNWNNFQTFVNDMYYL